MSGSSPGQVAALASARARSFPFAHWLVERMIGHAQAAAVRAIPVPAPPIADTLGRRETHNSLRFFFSPEARGRFPVCESLAAALQSEAAVRAFERMCGIDLKGSYLRVEYCQDVDGFWLEPHTDIAEKLLTVQICVTDEPGSADWGTDFYDAERRPVVRAPYTYTDAYVFVPGKDTWHGFVRRPISGIRRSIIVNYVKDAWRARHELAYPDRPIA